MKINEISRILIVFLVFNFVNTKDYNCTYRRPKVDYLENSTVICEFININFGRNDTFNPVIPVDSPRHWLQVYDYDDFEDYVEQINFINSNLYSIPNTIFTKFPSMKIFNGAHAALKELTSLSFNKAENLKYIFLQGNHLKILKDFIFVHCKNHLKVLDLSDNRIKTVQKFAFSSLSALEELNLSNNKIKALDDSTFQSLLKAKNIWLSNNQIQKISSKIFSKNNAELNIIYLNNNKLTAISEHAFEKLEKLQFLFLKGNECVNIDFINWRIFDNISIKYELRNCIRAFRKSHPDDLKRHNITLLLENMKDRIMNCADENQKYLEEEEKALEAIKELNKEV